MKKTALKSQNRAGGKQFKSLLLRQKTKDILLDVLCFLFGVEGFENQLQLPGGQLIAAGLDGGLIDSQSE